MAYPEKRRGRDGKDYYRARYQRPDGNIDTVKGSDGKVLRFPTKRTALKAAQAAEREADAAAGSGQWVPPEKKRTTFGEFRTKWWEEREELAASSEQSYGHYFKHFAFFDSMPLEEITKAHIALWEREQKAAGAAPSSVGTYRRVLHMILGDAAEEGRIPANPAARRRGRGKRAGRVAGHRGPERAITTALGALLLAERAALLSGRDDEFVGVTTKTYTGVRWGESVGLQPEFVRPEAGIIRVEYQLYELDSGELLLCPPKEDSYRDVDTPGFLMRLLVEQIGRRPAPCPCHQLRFVFRGRGPAGGGERREGPTLKDVAMAAKVSAGTVSNVLNRPHLVADGTRERVEKAVAELGYVSRQGGGRTDGEHWRRSGFSRWIFEPAATGWYPQTSPYPRRPVPVSAGPWPGMPLHGRNSAGRAEACWVAIRAGLTRHGLRHTDRAIMEELGTPKVLMDERMGHRDGSVSARYSHVTPEMRKRLLVGLTAVWEAALDARLALCRTSAVPVLERLLREREAAVAALS